MPALPIAPFRGPGRGRGSRSRRTKQILASLIAIGSLGSLSVGGTYALFKSQGSNAGSSVAIATFTLSNAVNEGTACYSYKGVAGKEPSNNVNEGCHALMASSTLNYPGVASVAKVAITNNGSLNAEDLSLYMPSCTNENTPKAPSPGSGEPCGVGGDELYVQETNSSWVATRCRYPPGEGACKWIANTLYIFDQNYKSTSSALDLGSGPEHGKARYFEIALRIPEGATNALQGRMAAFGLTWYALA